MMDSSTPTHSSDAHESEIFELLLKMSNTEPQGWSPQFPFLDLPTVTCLSQSIATTMTKGKSDLRKLLVPLLRKWCTGRNRSDLLNHSTWMGRSLSVRDCVEALLTVCIQSFKNESDWIKRDPEQQLAVCSALLGAATVSPTPLHPEAGGMCVLLIDRLLSSTNLDALHHRFLAQVWSSVGELPINSDTLTRLAEKSFLGIEMMLLRLGKRAIMLDHHSVAESFKTVVGLILLRVCCQSSSVFQNICNVFTHMMVVSEAHPRIQGLIKAFISGVEEECTKCNFDISALYEKPCQLVSALMCVEPSLLLEQGDEVLSRHFVLEMLNGLPQEKAAALLAQRPAWLLFTF